MISRFVAALCATILFPAAHAKLPKAMAELQPLMEFPGTAAAIPASYNVVWDSPSPDAWESMPLSGRLGAGANVWVQDGSLWRFLAHNEDGRLLKFGALRITPANGALKDPIYFKQEPVSWQKWQGSAWSLTAAASKRHTIVAALRAGQGSDPARWQADAKELLDEGTRKSSAADEAKRWDEFWSRSHLVINQDAGNCPCCSTVEYSSASDSTLPEKRPSKPT